MHTQELDKHLIASILKSLAHFTTSRSELTKRSVHLVGLQKPYCMASMPFPTAGHVALVLMERWDVGCNRLWCRE